MGYPSPLRRLLIASVLILMIALMFLRGELRLLRGRGHTASEGGSYSPKASEQFGEALQREGIATQAGVSR